ncbi:gem-associated protein 6-like [Trichogramma pretiosum]|uniref:gem-associated protein 6-like n=1 Tax=Trichogramma pretiosum TaxID=7493 RepID=UPI0006C96816|nr:gem-associated protein 6-like [Trichogramma pretiosum]
MSSQLSKDASTNFLPKIYTNDPILFRSYVNKKVTLTTEDGNVHIGIVYTIDPVSESVVLMQSKGGEDAMLMKIIMRSAIKSIDCSFENEMPLPEMFVTPIEKMSKEELLERRNSVFKLLTDSQFPVTEENGILLIEDTVRIEPPYRPENCICLNSTILSRMQDIVSRAYN